MAKFCDMDNVKVVDLYSEKYIPMWDYFFAVYGLTTTDFITSVVISGCPVCDALELMYRKYLKECKGF